MTAGRIYDVVVLGGGPAGLGSALNCARQGLSVLLLEQQPIGATRKSWLTFRDCIERYGLQECIRHEFSGVVFSSYLGGRFAFKDSRFICPIDEIRALTALAGAARAAGAELRERESYLNHCPDAKADTVTVTSSENTYQAKLVVDAMGRCSETLRSIGLANETLDMGCVCRYLEGVKHRNDECLLLYDSFFPGPDYFWLVPLEKDRMMAGLFFFSSLTDQNRSAKRAKLERYIEARRLGGKVTGVREGNIPLGPQVNIAADRTVSIGDSANTPLPSSGFSFNRCLAESEVLAKFARRFVDGDVAVGDYKHEVLGAKTPAIEVHLMISDMLSSFTDPMLNMAIAGMNRLDEEFLVSFLSGRDMSITFAANALRAILRTFSLGELSSLSLKQHHLRNLTNLYNLLPALPSAGVPRQLRDFILSLARPAGAKRPQR